MPTSKESPGIKKASYRDVTTEVTEAMKTLVRPGSGHVGCAEVLAVAIGLENSRLVELRSVPGGVHAQRLLALRYLMKNGAVWFGYFSWEKALTKLDSGAADEARALWSRIEETRLSLKDEAEVLAEISAKSLSEILAPVLEDLESEDALRLLLRVSEYDSVRVKLRERVCEEGPALFETDPQLVDYVYLLSQDLKVLPATTVGSGDLQYIIVADKGEMGTRAVREAIDWGATPVVLFSKQDDDGALQVRIAEDAGGFSIPLAGAFRDTYANPIQIAEKVIATFTERFGDEAEVELGRSAIYPGYGPLAENTAAIEVFRRNGLAFIGPMQDVVERAGDKRKFRILAESIDPKAVTPGIVMDESDPALIEAAVRQGAKSKKFKLPGRLKAANGGGGRGQVVLQNLKELPAAVTKVLGEISANGWDHGVMFEQNIFETTHLEVQIVRDRFGNTRHFGMRDCTEQRASQKIQEEAPPSILRSKKALEARMCDIAVRISDEVGYVGAATVELMYKDGHFYLLEMNTRIQVEHPVTEEAHRIRRGSELEPLNLVALQYRVAQGGALDFAQEDVVCSHVAREFRINAESYKPDIKDPRDGKVGLFLPNAGVFDEISVPGAQEVHDALAQAGVKGIDELHVRFDCGFEKGDDLVNKDPTFGKLIVSISALSGFEKKSFELLRQASLEVLRRMKIEGRQLLPNGKILEDRPLETNIADHIFVLETKMLQDHSRSSAKKRHVNWLIETLRAQVS